MVHDSFTGSCFAVLAFFSSEVYYFLRWGRGFERGSWERREALGRGGGMGCNVWEKNKKLKWTCNVDGKTKQTKMSNREVLYCVLSLLVFDPRIEMREGIRSMEETAKTKGHLRSHLKTQHSTSFLKYVHVWQKSKSNNGGDKVPTRHLSYSNETFSARNGLYIIEFLVIVGSMENSKRPSILLWLLIASQKQMIMLSCWRKYLQKSLKVKNLSCCLPRVFTPTDDLLFMVLEGSVPATKGER